MATFYSDLAAKQNSPTMGNRVEGVRASGTLHVATPTVTLESAVAANDVVNLIKLSENTIIIPELCHVYSDGVATTATIDIGDDDATTAVDADRYADGLNVAAAGYDAFTSGTAPAASASRYKLQAESWITATFATLATPTVGGKLHFVITYAIV